MPLLKRGLRENNGPPQRPSLSVTTSAMANTLWHTTKRQLILIITAPWHHSSFWQAFFLRWVDWGGVEPQIGGTRMTPSQMLREQAGWMNHFKQNGAITDAFVPLNHSWNWTGTSVNQQFLSGRIYATMTRVCKDQSILRSRYRKEPAIISTSEEMSRDRECIQVGKICESC